ncbi:MAG: phosphodiester glycosidase family protein [Defluviitaleaceae bacterium]|nr:phosphodiester glycosidase family protein [Defluviitaleaceae bacterium]
MKKNLKRSMVFAALCAVFASSFPSLQTQAAPQILFEETQTTRLSNNTYLIESTRITSAGLVDINLLRIPLNDPYLEIGVFNSQVQFGLKQPATTLLNQHGAFAGVNGDFFGLAGRHSVPLGLEVVDGHFSVHRGLNYTGNLSASFLMGEGGVFTDYIRVQIALLLDGESPFEVSSMNMVTSLYFPSFLTHGYVANTSEIDVRFPRTYKLVVENNIITNITHESVYVPQNGFVVIMNENTFAGNYHLFYIGQRAEMEFYTSVDYAAVHTAISGENRILHHGEIPNIPATRATGRNPRTILGICRYGETLFLMTIDGRNHSIGATLAEAAHYIRDFGAYHAIALDGGGSTTMAAARPAGNLALVNSPSEGTQRNIINTIGVVNHAPVGDVTSFGILGQERIAVGIPASISFMGFDAYMNAVDISDENVNISVLNGELVSGSIIAHSAGDVHVIANFGGLTTTTVFEAIEVAEITTSINVLPVGFNINALPNFIGIDNFGRRVNLNPSQLQLQVYPNVDSPGWLGVAAHHARLYIPVVGNALERSTTPINAASFSSYPAGISGRVEIFNDGVAALHYTFAAANISQAAFINLGTDFVQDASYLSVYVYGNNSNHWLRGNLIDETGNVFTIDFVRSIDFLGWREINVAVPNDAVGAVRLSRIWAVSLSQDYSEGGSIFIRPPQFLRSVASNAVNLPASTVAADPLRANLAAQQQQNTLDIVLTPQNIPESTIQGLAIVSLDASNGGILSTHALGWQNLLYELRTTTAGTIVIHTNTSPLYYNNQREFELLHSFLQSLSANVFVMSNGGQSSWAGMVDGVRYLNLPYDGNEALQLRFGADGVRYDIVQ